MNPTYSDYVPATDDKIRVSDLLHNISSKIRSILYPYPAFVDAPPNILVLAQYLYMKYQHIRENISSEEHLKQYANYAFPESGLSAHFQNLTVYIDSITQIPNILEKLEEILFMIEVCRNPQPLTY